MEELGGDANASSGGGSVCCGAGDGSELTVSIRRFSFRTMRGGVHAENGDRPVPDRGKRNIEKTSGSGNCCGDDGANSAERMASQRAPINLLSHTKMAIELLLR